jgi:hypothetical protein
MLIGMGCGTGKAKELEVGWNEPVGVKMWTPTTTDCPIRNWERINKAMDGRRGKVGN